MIKKLILTTRHLRLMQLSYLFHCSVSVCHSTSDQCVSKITLNLDFTFTVVLFLYQRHFIKVLLTAGCGETSELRLSEKHVQFRKDTVWVMVVIFHALSKRVNICLDKDYTLHTLTLVCSCIWS